MLKALFCCATPANRVGAYAWSSLVDAKDFLEELSYSPWLECSRDGTTTSKLEHLDGRCKKDTQSRQLKEREVF